MTSVGSVGGATSVSTSSANSGGSGGCEPPPCEPLCPPYECGDCEDNDGDGLVDMESPYCVSPCQASESGFLGVAYPGEYDPCKRDCFYDGNMGSGDDGCVHPLQCDPASPGSDFCAYDPDYPSCPPPPGDGCLAQCGPLTPNGCDCFGCCELPAGSGEYRLLGSFGYPGCTLEDLTDCPLCTPTPECFNACDPCEICVGKPAVLPPECGALQQCPDGAPRCGLPCQPACPKDWYCLTGCCEKSPFVP